MVKEKGTKQPSIEEIDFKISMEREKGYLEGENKILKQILEQLLKIQLLPKLFNTEGSF